MNDLTLEEVQAHLETLAQEYGDHFDTLQSKRVAIDATLPGHPESSLDTLLPLNPTVGGQRKQGIDFVESLAKGGMGEIFLARQNPIGRQVAVKRLKANKYSEQHKRSLLKEGWINGRLQHPNIVPVYTLGIDDEDQPAIVMKLIGGVTLAELLDDFDKLPAAFAAESPLESYIQILIQVCNALSYTHDQGFIHRDIKPANIMVGQYGEVYLLDWGIAIQIEPGQPEELERRSAEGTPAYMAPEMVAPSFARLSERTDIFLLGACLHHILTGELLNDGDNYVQVLMAAFDCKPRHYSTEVPEELAAVATKAMAKEPANRYATVTEFRRELRHFLNTQSSRRLAGIARQKLGELEEMVATDNGVSRHELYPVFGACRLGFEQALDVHPDSREARQGLNHAVELMIDWELRHRGATTAETLLNALSQPNPEVSARVERALKRAERNHQESVLTRLSPDGVLAIDGTGTIVYSNDQVTQLFGWAAEELRDQKLEILIPKSKRAAHIRYRQTYQSHPKSRSMNAGLTLEGLHKDGSRVDVNISLAPVSSQGRQLTVASIREAAPVVAIDQPSMSRDSMELFDCLSLPLFVLQEGRFLWANKAFEQLLGQQGGRVLPGRLVDQFFPGRSHQFPDYQALQTAPAIELQGVKTMALDDRQFLLDLRFLKPPGERFKGALLVEARCPELARPLNSEDSAPLEDNHGVQ